MADTNTTLSPAQIADIAKTNFLVGLDQTEEYGGMCESLTESSENAGETAIEAGGTHEDACLVGRAFSALVEAKFGPCDWWAEKGDPTPIVSE